MLLGFPFIIKVAMFNLSLCLLVVDFISISGRSVTSQPACPFADTHCHPTTSATVANTPRFVYSLQLHASTHTPVMAAHHQDAIQQHHGNLMKRSSNDDATYLRGRKPPPSTSPDAQYARQSRAALMARIRAGTASPADHARLQRIRAYDKQYKRSTRGSHQRRLATGTLPPAERQRLLGARQRALERQRAVTAARRARVAAGTATAADLAFLERERQRAKKRYHTLKRKVAAGVATPAEREQWARMSKRSSTKPAESLEQRERRLARVREYARERARKQKEEKRVLREAGLLPQRAKPGRKSAADRERLAEEERQKEAEGQGGWLGDVKEKSMQGKGGDRARNPRNGKTEDIASALEVFAKPVLGPGDPNGDAPRLTDEPGDGSKGQPMSIVKSTRLSHYQYRGHEVTAIARDKAVRSLTDWRRLAVQTIQRARAQAKGLSPAVSRIPLVETVGKTLGVMGDLSGMIPAMMNRISASRGKALTWTIKHWIPAYSPPLT